MFEDGRKDGIFYHLYQQGRVDSHHLDGNPSRLSTARIGFRVDGTVFMPCQSDRFDRVVVFTVPPDVKPVYGATVKFYEKHEFVIKKRYRELCEDGAIELVKTFN